MLPGAVAQVSFDGIVSGLVTGLLAMGIVLVYRSTRVLNFAVGNIGLVGATLLSVLVVRYHVPFGVALPVAVLVGILFAVVIELAVIRRLFTAPRVIVLVATIGIAELALAAASALPSLGSSFAGYPVAWTGTWHVIGLQVSGAQISVLVAVPVIGLGLSWFLNRTTVGRSVQAAADNPDLARLSSINPKLISTLVWGISGLLGTVAVILAAGQGLSASDIAQLGPDTLAAAMVAAVIAGLRSFSRALVAGVLVGLVTSVLSYNFINQPGLVDLVLLVAVLIAVWAQSRRPERDPQVYPSVPTSRAIPEYLRSLWWVRNLDRAWFGVAVVIGVLLPLIVTEPSKILLYGTILAYALCASSLTVLTGWSGVLSLGQMAFAGLGALIAAALTNGLRLDVSIGSTRLVAWNPHPIPFVLSIVIATVAMAVLATVVGAGARRARGMLLAVSTFALAIAAENFIYGLPVFSNGNSGSVPFVRGRLFGLDLSSQRTYYYVLLVVLIIIVLLLVRLRRSGIGRGMIAVRDNPEAAASLTVSPSRLRLQAFALSGAIAGLGGALLAGTIESVPYGQDFFLVNDSLVLVAIVVIGGLGSTSGALLGALWVIGMPAFFPSNSLVPLLTSSIGLLVMLLYFPGGFAQMGVALRNAVVSSAARRVTPAPAKQTHTTPTLLRRAPDGEGRAPEAGVPALAVRSVDVRFGGNHAVAAVSMAVAKDEIVGLIGANGAGKSTLVNAIGGYIPSTGAIELGGRDITSLSVAERAAAGLGRTFQGAQLFPELTVRDTVALSLEARGRSCFTATALCLPGSWRIERRHRQDAADLVDFLGLGRYADRAVAELSTGTRRILELACLLGQGATVLCLDEPTAGVAQREAEAFGPLLVDLRRELDASMLVIEHDMPLLMSLSDRMVCLDAGQVIAEGPPEKMRRDPRVIASYLGTDERAVDRSSVTGGTRPEYSQMESNRR